MKSSTLNNSSHRTAYLTIDDGPSKDMQSKLDYLVAKNIPAIWFCLGLKIEENTEAALNAIRQGHIIGNHSYDHPKFSQRDLNDCFSQINRTDEILTGLYQKAEVTWHDKYFRFPYGDNGAGDRHPSELIGQRLDFRKTLQKHLHHRGYIQPSFTGITNQAFVDNCLLDQIDVYWTYDTMDWALTSPQYPNIKSTSDLLNRINTNLGKRTIDSTQNSNEIILIHDHDYNTNTFISIIEKLIKLKFFFDLPN